MVLECFGVFSGKLVTKKMELKTKRRLTMAATGLFFFVSGVEYAIIIPTVHLYIEDLGGAPSFLGFALSAFSLSGLVAAPIFGFLQDRYHKTKLLVLVANMFEIVGNFMYFVGGSLWMLLCSRLVAGIGNGVTSSIIAQIARTTTKKQRTSAISIAMALQQIGLLLGPGFNLFLADIHFYIGPFEVNSYTVPGIFMCLMWTMVQIVFIFCYFDLPTLAELKEPNQSTENTVSNTAPSLVSSMPGNVDDNQSPRYDSMIQPYQQQSADRFSNNSDHNYQVYDSELPAEWTGVVQATDDESRYREIGDKREMVANTPIRTRKDEYLREEIVVLLASQFVFVFEKMCVQTAITPMAQLTMDFDEIENSIVYCVSGAEVILCFVLVKILSKRMSDRALLMVGFAIEIAALVILMIFYPNAPDHNRQANLAWFCVAVIVQVAGLAFCSVAIISLYSKLVSQASQGFSQGIRRSVGGVATILGPLWAGGAVQMGYVLLGVMLFLFLLVTGMLTLSWPALAVPKNTKEADQLPANDAPSPGHNENTPLLVNADE